jgi:hypothetical protein
MRRKKLRPTHLALLALAALVPNASLADDRANCDAPAFAQAYTFRFNQNFKVAKEAHKAKEASHQQRIDALKQQMIAAGAWTPQQAGLFLAEAAKAQDLEKLEAVRKKKARELLDMSYAFDGVAFVGGNDHANATLMRCRLGFDSFERLAALQSASGQYWDALASKILDAAKEQNLAVTDKPE